MTRRYPGSQGQRNGDDSGQQQPVKEPASTLFVVASPKRLSDQGVESEHEAHSEHRQREEQDAPDTDGPDRLRAQLSDHRDVDNLHGKPTDLGHDDRGRQRQHGPKLARQTAE